MSGRPAPGLIVFAAVFGWRAVKHLSRVVRTPEGEDSSIRLVLGIPAFIVAVTSIAFALGIA